MAYVLDRMKPLFKFIEVKAAEKKDAETLERKKPNHIWPRLLVFRPSSSCDDDEEIEKEPENSKDEECPKQPLKYNVEIEEQCEDDDEESAEEQNRKNEEVECKDGSKSYIRRFPGCMYRGAKRGLRDGALTGIFIGGCWGMYKYFGGEKGEGSEDEESTLNNNIIFVTAANCAIAMAVFATIFCSTKAAIFCN